VVRTYALATSSDSKNVIEKMHKSITTINALANILDEIIKEVNESNKKSGDSSAPQKKVSLDLGHCIMCFKLAIPQNWEKKET
jgi:hypothetical protein